MNSIKTIIQIHQGLWKFDSLHQNIYGQYHPDHMYKDVEDQRFYIITRFSFGKADLEFNPGYSFYDIKDHLGRSRDDTEAFSMLGKLVIHYLGVLPRILFLTRTNRMISFRLKLSKMKTLKRKELLHTKAKQKIIKSALRTN